MFSEVLDDLNYLSSCSNNGFFLLRGAGGDEEDRCQQTDTMKRKPKCDQYQSLFLHNNNSNNIIIGVREKRMHNLVESCVQVPKPGFLVSLDIWFGNCLLLMVFVAFMLWIWGFVFCWVFFHTFSVLFVILLLHFRVESEQ